MSCPGNLPLDSWQLISTIGRCRPGGKDAAPAQVEQLSGRARHRAQRLHQHEHVRADAVATVPVHAAARHRHHGPEPQLGLRHQHHGPAALHGGQLRRRKLALHSQRRKHRSRSSLFSCSISPPCWISLISFSIVFAGSIIFNRLDLIDFYHVLPFSSDST